MRLGLALIQVEIPTYNRSKYIAVRAIEKRGRTKKTILFNEVGKQHFYYYMYHHLLRKNHQWSA